MSDVEMNVCMRGRAASFTAFHAASMSATWVRARPAMTGPSTVREISWTASKSPGEVIGKPASITSTPSRASCWAISSFSCVFSEMPGDCSPSRSVVSKMRTWELSAAPVGGALVEFVGGAAVGALVELSVAPAGGALRLGSSGWGIVAPRCLELGFFSVLVSRLRAAAHALFPPKGEEKKSESEAERHAS